MRIIDLHIAKTLVVQVLLVLAVLLGLFVFVNFLDQLGELGRGDFGILDAVKYVALTIPRTIYDLFPMVGLLGTMLAMSHLAQDSELVVLRSSGLSLFRITASVLKVGVVMAILAVLLGEFVTPWSETAAQRTRAEALQRNIQQQGNRGLWLRDDQTYVNIGEVLPDLTLVDLRLFEFDSARKLRSLATAKRATFGEGAWKLEQVNQTVVSLEKGSTQTIDRANWQTVVTPDILQVFLIQPDQLSIRQLRRYVRHLEDNSQDTAKWKLAFWGKLILPIATCVMVVLAIPFVFSQIRAGGLGRNLLIGIMLGLVFYVANKSFGYLVLVYNIAPVFGAVIPTVVFMVVSIVMLRRAS